LTVYAGLPASATTAHDAKTKPPGSFRSTAAFLKRVKRP